MKYLSTTTFKMTEIHPASAALDDVLDAYNSLFAMSDDGGAFPGSAEWKRAKSFREQLNELISYRPEIEDYRKDLQKKAHEEAMKDVNVWSN